MTVTAPDPLSVMRHSTFSEQGLPMSDVPMSDFPERFRDGEAVYEFQFVELVLGRDDLAALYRDQAGRCLRVIRR